jgi:hypothetical protein
LLISGQPGIGKTETIKQSVNWIRDIANGSITSNKAIASVILSRKDYWSKIQLRILHPVTHNPVNYSGFPWAQVIDGKARADFLPFAYLAEMMEADFPLVVFFDDLGQAVATVQAALMQVLLERAINGKAISDTVCFVAATNRRKDNAGVSVILTPLLNRFSTIVEMEFDMNDWCKWAINHGMPLPLVAFIRFSPKSLADYSASKEIKGFATPRSVAELGQWINEGMTDIDVWEGCVGNVFAIEFKAFYDSFAALNGLPEKIFANPMIANVPTQPDIIYTLCNVLAKRATDTNINNVFKYIDRIPREFGMVFISDIESNRSELLNSSGYINWTIKNKDVV